MAEEFVSAAVGVELARPGANNGRAGQGHESAHRVHHAGAGVVGRAEDCQPAVAIPDPVPVEGVDDGADEEAVGKVGLGLGPLGHRTGHDGGGGAGEHHLEHPVHVNLPVAPAVDQEEVIGAGDASRRTAHHYGETKSPEGQGRDGKVHKALGHVVDGALGTDEAGAKKGEARLHKEHQERRNHGG